MNAQVPTTVARKKTDNSILSISKPQLVAAKETRDWSVIMALWRGSNPIVPCVSAAHNKQMICYNFVIFFSEVGKSNQWGNGAGFLSTST